MVYITKNFMCHRELSFKLCHNLNIIHGVKGSGKLRIIAAIQVYLGDNGVHLQARDL